MGIFSNWFGKQNQVKKNKSSILTINSPSFSTLVNVRDNDVFMSAVLCNARHTSKVNVRAYRKDDVINNDLTFLLSRRPNRLMSASSFWEKARINYDCDTNVFIYLDWEILPLSKKLKSLWVIDPTGIQIATDENRNIWFSFYIDGKQIYCDESQIAVISKNINRNEFFGNGNSSIK